MIHVLERQVIGYRADGRAVSLVRGGAEEGAAAATAAAADTGQEGAAGAGQEGAAGDGSEEVEFSEASFKELIDKHNALQAAQTAKDEEWRQKLHTASQDASKYRQQARTLATLVGEGATGKPGPKAAAAKTAAAAAAAVSSEADTRLAELSAQLEETRRDGLLLGARAALSEAGVPKAAVAKAVRLIDLDALERRGAGEIGGLDEQIAELKESMPQLFAPAQAAAPVASGTGTGAGARVLRAAPAVAGKGAAGRGGEAPKAPTTAEVLANRLLGKGDE